MQQGVESKYFTKNFNVNDIYEVTKNIVYFVVGSSAFSLWLHSNEIQEN